MPQQISFCTTCANRATQLKQTFAANTGLIRQRADLEWIIVNFGSVDDLDAFMLTQLPELPARIVYARERSGRPWHASIAKNVAHRLGTGEILMNLDCDNFIGDAVDVIKVHFIGGVKVLHLWSGTLGDGTYGRVAIDRRLFHALGGYDESFYPMGYQDFDVIARAIAAGAQARRHQSSPTVAIKNTKAEGIRYVAKDGKTWDDYNRANRARSQANIRDGRLVANAPKGWSELNVEVLRGGLVDA